MSVNREEFYRALKTLDDQSVAGLIKQAYEQDAQVKWSNMLTESPHGRPWNTSFHASSFPGDDNKSCPRSSLYTLMGFPPVEPFSYNSLTIMDLGKDIEKRIVTRLYMMGILLSAPPWEDVQTGFVDEAVWLTGACDAIVEIPGMNRPHVLEIKTKSDEHIQLLKKGLATYDDPHRSQLLTYVSMANAVSSKLWPDLDPVVDGTLLYASRSNPTNMIEFAFDIDHSFYESGKEKLSQWREMFSNDVLPERPSDWRWSEVPCKWCKYKKEICKPDMKDKITKLSESNGIKWAKEIYGDYNTDEVMNGVSGSWNE